MALPNMPSLWTSRKNVYEAAIVRRRNQEDDFREKWQDTSRYFHDTEIGAVKQTAWTSEDSFHDSMDAYKSQHNREIKAMNLKRRRLKLTDMLQKERDVLEAELRGYSADNYDRISDMKERSENLRSAREEKRKQLAEEKLYDHFRKNNPDLRELESRAGEQEVIEEWEGQVEEQKRKQEQEIREKALYEQLMEEERQAALKFDQELEREKIQEEKKLKSVLRDQVEELKQREREAERLKFQAEELQKQQWELEKLEDQRKEMDEIRKKEEFGRVLLRQHKAKLLQRSKQVQEQLELDRRILEALTEKAEEDRVLQTARKEKARADAAWMKQVIDEQLRLEKAREAELDMLYQDEASRMWQKREAEWERERQARERLMNEVLQGRQEQIEDRMEEIRKKQEESLERREELLRELDIAQQMTRREQEEEMKLKTERKQQLQAQMTSRREQKISAQDQLLREMAEEKKAEEDYEEMLRREAERMNIRGFGPKKFGKKQAWQ
ncbi:trichoplein keratin filament-binding protein [Lingula anatina]|uniref:Trichoplein keratin filament-binding protein n=1 Tax=Lingula anatina TaxID=7574 RepID=A0A1S3H0D4_LINAN|nr:trichoplein keratin filament-binding protein [Lingula anatina]|eukprot:XP_013379463.1 trichoplein keratin filament-binding protein [Lingula anatina]